MITTAVNAKRSLEGVWKSEGYGYLLEFRGDNVQFYESTPISCIPTLSGVRRDHKSGLSRTEFIFGENALTISVVASNDDPGEAYLCIENSTTVIKLRRIECIPVSCGDSACQLAEFNFRVFWETFYSHYAFMRERGLNWNAVWDLYFDRAKRAQSVHELQAILIEMVCPLGDYHVRVDHPDRSSFSGVHAWGSQSLDGGVAIRSGEIIRHRYIKGELHTWCNGRIAFGLLTDALGYLCISDFYLLDPKGNFQHGRQGLAAALDIIMEQARSLDALVVDIRKNTGGAELYGIDVASRFAEKQYVAYVRRVFVRDGGLSRLTEGQQIYVNPTRGRGFGGKIVVLAGRHTVSAGETFMLALMNRPREMTSIGERTQGALSGVLRRRLPNGIRFTLPNEVYLSEDNRCFEVRGIQCDVAAPIFPESDLRNGTDSALEVALRMLSHN